MASKFWSKLSISKPKILEGIISKDEPLSLSVNDSMTVLTDTDYSIADMKFVFNHSVGVSGNSHILDPKLYERNVNIKIVNSKNTTELYGFILSLPHCIGLKKESTLEIIQTGVTTDLCVHKDYRAKNLAAHLILGVIQKGFLNSIYTGYHYIKEAKSESALKISNYYRPLNVQTCLDCGYDIPSFRIKNFLLKTSVHPETESLIKIENEYIIHDTNKFIITDSEFEDLTYLQNNKKLCVIINEERFNFMKANGFKFKTIHGSNKYGVKTFIVGLFIYKNRVLYISKTKKSLNSACMALIEVSQNNTYEIVHSIYNHLVSENYNIMTGSLFGNLIDNTLRKQLSMVICGYQYLDFYNLHVEHNNDVSKINLLYF